ncbi:MAG: hypothetical protein HYY18_03845 [Planctomycetes bacterium]|nr:hypothetical protein [Planctomycetota bacterium]
MRLLFVCTANAIRSPMAEMIAKHVLAKGLGVAVEGLPAAGWVIESAGVDAFSGSGMVPEAEAALRELGVEPGAHRRRSVTLAMLGVAERIYGMGRAHVEMLRAWAPHVEDRIALLDPVRDVEDPVGRGLEAHRRTAEQIRKAVERILAECQRFQA